ncbi:MAG TPA: YqaA family protein [Caulobacteraceae bacterium]|nr:YqaA family protein [Caulobacteraceae bacterium]
MRLAGGKHAVPAMAAVSFAESSFFPIPPDVMLGPMVLARPDRAYFYAFVCTAASVLGGFAGYAIGYYAQPLGEWLLRVLGHGEGIDTYRTWFDQYGLWVILGKGVTPIPYKVVTIAAGLAKYSLFTFLWASILTRGIRFFIVAWVLKRFGPKILEVVERRLAMVTMGLVVLIVVGFVLLKLIPH